MDRCSKRHYIARNRKNKMNVINNVSFQGQVPKREKRANNIAAVVGGPLAAAGIVATYGIGSGKSLKGNTLMGTIKNHAKLFTQDCKNIAAGLCEFTKQHKWADNIAKLKNTDKRVFGAGLLAYSLILGGAIKLGAELGSKLRHRN